MKITRKQLRQIIKEELSRSLLAESDPGRVRPHLSSRDRQVGVFKVGDDIIMKGLSGTSHNNRNRYGLSTDVRTGTANIAITSIQSTRPPGSIKVGANAEIPKWQDRNNIFDTDDPGTDPDPISQAIADAIVDGYETDESFSISAHGRDIDFTKLG